MQNTMQKFRQNSIVLRNQVFCLKIWKFWRAPTNLQFSIFCWNFAQIFYLPLSTKGCVRLFLFSLDLEFSEKNRKDLVSTHSFSTLLLITQDLISGKRCAKFQQKIIKSMVVGARQSFQFFRQKAWFLGNNRGLP